MGPPPRKKPAAATGSFGAAAVGHGAAGGAQSTAADMASPGPEQTAAFELACEKTRSALRALAKHWQEVEPLAEAALRVAEEPPELSRDGCAWSQEVGLAYVVPTGALQCQPARQSVGREGLLISSVGGPAIPTHGSLLVAPAPPCGFGVYATSGIGQGERLGEYVGEARRYDLWCGEIKAKKVAARGSDVSSPFIRDELYAAWAGTGPTGAGVVLDAYAVGNAMRFINCSCKPNCSFKSFGHGPQSHYRLEVVALRGIAPWEQLSVDYGWYYDDATLEEIRARAVEAYHRDLPVLRGLPSPADSPTPHSEAARVLVCAMLGTQGQPDTGTLAGFLRRFVDPAALAAFLEGGGRFDEVSGFRGVPAAVWHLYEVVGAAFVGVPCRCALNPSLNCEGKCSGIIGRPLQALCSGRDDVELVEW